MQVVLRSQHSNQLSERWKVLSSDQNQWWRRGKLILSWISVNQKSKAVLKWINSYLQDFGRRTSHFLKTNMISIQRTLEILDDIANEWSITRSTILKCKEVMSNILGKMRIALREICWNTIIDWARNKYKEIPIENFLKDKRVT